VLEHSRRPAKVLLRALSEQPSLFIEMLSAVFKASEESGVVDPEPQDPEHARAVATQAYRLLELWNQIPGTRDDGMIDGEALEAWIKEARALAKAAGREDIADSRIGNMLSASPMGSDGNWPAEAVREVIDLFRSKAMIEGFQIGKSNRRGVTTRMPGSGGNSNARKRRSTGRGPRRSRTITSILPRRSIPWRKVTTGRRADTTRTPSASTGSPSVHQWHIKQTPMWRSVDRTGVAD
jgi:hypothetical protein